MFARILAPFLPYIIGAALLSALGGVIWWQSGTIDDLQNDVARLERSEASLLKQQKDYKRAASIAAKRAQNLQEMNEAANEAIEKIRNLDLGECADAKIDPALTDALGRRNVPRTD